MRYGVSIALCSPCRLSETRRVKRTTFIRWPREDLTSDCLPVACLATVAPTEKAGDSFLSVTM